MPHFDASVTPQNSGSLVLSIITTIFFALQKIRIYERFLESFRALKFSRHLDSKQDRTRWGVGQFPTLTFCFSHLVWYTVEDPASRICEKVIEKKG